MAASGWRKGRSVADLLFKEGHRFDFYQAVRLLEMLDPVGASVGEGPDASAEVVRFSSSLKSAFPASDLDRVEMPGAGRQFGMQVNFMGLAGAFGPLPPPITELVIERLRARDGTARDFLDQFNHRLVSLMFRARRAHRPELVRGTPDDTNFAFYFYCLLGLGTGGLRNRMDVPDRALLDRAGLLNQQPRSLHALERLVEAHFGVPVEGIPLQGRWLPLSRTETTSLGIRKGMNNALGSSVVLGARAWDQQAALTVSLGPLDLPAFRGFLPVGDAWAPLVSLLRFHAGRMPDFSVRLRLKPAQVPGTRLDRKAPPRLGWTSFLTTRPRTSEGVVTIAVEDDAAVPLWKRARRSAKRA
ncbi:type VI secretion system baseplate subunit TssG [Arenibaculum sp.]|jgi:type VI secretion system protein ImpH|uniref:type VI secretion system baseplate subunit TssG n=1 Tax=Arenibaculum sp. TaxID=2865862 RepID=UPI002E11EA7F|nr:type VI secretion system baseplate subunit TssG [Arenibaculum sp.]